MKEKVCEKIEILSNGVEETLSKLTEAINDVIIQICKSLNQTQEGTNNIEKRVRQLEKGLGEDQVERIELDSDSLDPEKLQVSLPVVKIEFEDLGIENIQDDTNEDQSLQFVKESIVDGKPDRVAVIQWIKDEKEKNSDTTYAHLARVLTEAEIPTLSGRDNWNRTVIRKMALEP